MREDARIRHGFHMLRASNGEHHSPSEKLATMSLLRRLSILLHSKMAWSLLVVAVTFLSICSPACASSDSLSQAEVRALKEEARDMFYHAYDAYMDNAFPADELMPLSCSGRFRGVQHNRGDIDDALGK